MNDRPRLKGKDEILDSLRKKAPDLSSSAPPPSSEEAELISSMVDAGAARPRRASRPGRRPERQAAGPRAEEEDRNPLDMSRFELPARRSGRAGEPITVPLPEEEPGETQRRRSAPRNTRPREEAAVAVPKSIPDSEAPPDAPRELSAPGISAPPPGAVQDYQFERLIPPQEQAGHEGARPGEGDLPPRSGREERDAHPGQSAPRREEPEPAGQKGTLLGDADYRNSFLQQLSSAFEEKFEEKFEHGPTGRAAARPQAKVTRVPSAPPRRAAEERREPLPERRGEERDPFEASAIPLPATPGDPEADRQAKAFVDLFRQDVQREEHSRAEERKETLAEKFLREREQYLRELGIGGEEEPGEPERPIPGVQPPLKRKLDIDIRPEMHMQEGELPPLRPVTYSSSGAARLQQETGEPEEDAFPDRAEPRRALPRQMPGREPEGKKTSEQLLFELAAQGAERPSRQAQAAPAQPGFRFAPPGEEAAPKKKWGKKWFSKKPDRIFWISAVAGVLALALVGLAVGAWIQLGNLGKQIEETGDSSGAPAPQDLAVYETRQFRDRGQYSNVVVKKGNILLQNVAVREYLVIEDIPTAGEVRLQDVSVDGAIYLRSSAVNVLKLDNVKTARVVVANSESQVELQIGGASEIGTVEVKTPARVVQAGMLDGAQGARDLLVKGAREGESLSVSLSGLDLQTLATEGEAILSFEENTRVEMLSAQGPLSLRGAARIVNLAAQAAPGGEATLPLQLHDVAVTNLSLKSPAGVELAGQVDTLATASPLALSGSGGVGSLTVNPGAGAGRLAIDLAGINVQSLIANAEAKVSSLGGARINALTANESVYAMGGKVNHLTVNAPNVIYEEEPDRITVKSGVRPPQSAADNPNLDFTAGSSESFLPTDATGDEVATTCGHARESGGFVKGDGSRDAPFEVDSALRLAHLSAHLSSHFIQTGEIDIADESRYASGFPMIASGGVPFSGVYDGGGYAIRNLRVSSDAENVGLFAENTGTLLNVHLLSGEVRSTSGGRAYAGGIVGLNYGGGSVTASANGARVTGAAAGYAGGVAGYNYGGKIRDSYNAGKISGAGLAGGLAGVNREAGSVTGCYNVGLVEGTGQVGAVVGSNENAAVANCYYLAETAAKGIGSGAGTALERSGAEMRSAQMVLDLAAGRDNSPWTAAAGGGYSYPVLNKASVAVVPESPSPAQSGTEGNPPAETEPVTAQ